MSAVWGAFLLLIHTQGMASADKNCPDLKGKYSVHSADGRVVDDVNTVLGDAAKLWKINLNRVTDGEIEIRGQTRQSLSFFWITEKHGVTPVVAASEWRFNQDYTCEKGWVIFSQRSPAFRNNLPGLYKGSAEIRLAKADPYGGLKIESAFSGHEMVNLYSYDSAHIDFPKWWSRKKLKETFALDSASPASSAAVPPAFAGPAGSLPTPVSTAESQSARAVRQQLSQQLLGPLILGGVQDRKGVVIVTLNARKLPDVKLFEDRLRAENMPYQIKTEPLWTHNAYFLEMIMEPKR